MGKTEGVSADRGGAAVPSAAVRVSVAFVPAAPLLIPVVEGTPDAGTTELRRACAEAVSAMLAPGPRSVVVVGAAPRGTRYGAGDVAGLHGLGLDVVVPFAGPPAPGGAVAAAEFGGAAWLLDRAGFAGERCGVAPEDLGTVLAEATGPVGVLALGDGSARRTVKAPGYLDEDAKPFDAAVAAALATGDADALAALDPGTGERLMAAGVPVWRAVGAALAGRPVAARLHADVAPFGVGYLVADWAAA